MNKLAMPGLDGFSGYGMIFKKYAQTPPDKIVQSWRALPRRTKRRFHEEGIEIAAPHQLLLQRTD
jgi:small-conductance mechanosensitive channel